RCFSCRPGRLSSTPRPAPAAPCAQCEPRLIGLSQAGSCSIHTPLATWAMTVQPTEQCVQTFLRTVTAAPGGGGGPASALRTAPTDKVPTAARLPAARPDRRRKLRRSRSPLVCGGSAAPNVLRRSSRCALLISTILFSHFAG